jgi:hypothetical protein
VAEQIDGSLKLRHHPAHIALRSTRCPR